jgi:hypothetical protein
VGQELFNLFGLAPSEVGCTPDDSSAARRKSFVHSIKEHKPMSASRKRLREETQRDKVERRERLKRANAAKKLSHEDLSNDLAENDSKWADAYLKVVTNE